MDDSFDDLFRSAEKRPSYWMQVALLEFLQSLDAVRVSKGLSNKELARLVGVSPPTLSRWLNGNENLTISTMCRLATALGAAVHIHVADNTKKGQWQVETGKAKGQKSRHRLETTVYDNVLSFPDFMPAAPSSDLRSAPPIERKQQHG